MRYLISLLFSLVCFLSSSEVTPRYINDVSKLNRTYVRGIHCPQNIDELRVLINCAPKPISIAGGCFSQGGHIAYAGGTVINLENFNKIKKIDTENKLITVEAGATWRDVQRFIAPYNLSVKVMQSYNDFSIGGSLSVNVHGRDIAYGPIIETVEEIQVLCADGTVKKASRSENSDLFAAAIGGYGAMGIILQATFSLTKNEPLQRCIHELTIDEYQEYFFKHVYGNENLVLHNADLYPNQLTKVMSVGYFKTHEPVPIERSGLQDYSGPFLKEMLGEQLLRRFPFSKKIRPKLARKELLQDTICSRNFEMSYTTQSLEPLVRFPSTSILQEYFVPTDRLTDFVDLLRSTVKKGRINLLNVSMRYIPKNTESMLSYAQQDSFALVLYINVINTSWGQRKARKWTRKLVNHALDVGGVYYLPYQSYPTKYQFQKAYPRVEEFMRVKREYDPHNIFSNSFLQNYMA